MDISESTVWDALKIVLGFLTTVLMVVGGFILRDFKDQINTNQKTNKDTQEALDKHKLESAQTFITRTEFLSHQATLRSDVKDMKNEVMLSIKDMRDESLENFTRIADKLDKKQDRPTNGN